MRLWIKGTTMPAGAEGGLVIEGAVIVELLPKGGAPSSPIDKTFSPSRHVVLPGLICQ